VLAKVRLQQSEDTMFAVVLGVGTGVVGGIVAAGILSILAIKGDQGEMTRAIMLVAHAADSNSALVGWLVLIAAGAAIGALFGIAMLGLRRESAAFWATMYGIAWWVVGWSAVMPPPLRFAPRAAIKDPALFQLAVAGLLACLGFGAVLAAAFTLFGRARTQRSDERAQAARAAASSNGALTSGRR
jgi:hypothetical protein